MSNQFNFFSKLQVWIKNFPILNLFKHLFFIFDSIVIIFFKKPKKCEKKQVLILANLGLGDAMDFLSVANKYRKYYDKEIYEITFVTSNGLKKLFESESDFDNIYQKNFNEITVNLKKRFAFINFLREKYWDVAIEIMGPNGCSPSLYLMHTIKADNKYSLLNKAISNCPMYMIRKTYNNLFTVDDIKMSNIEYYNRAYEMICNDKNNIIEYVKTKQYDKEVDLPKDYYIVFPSASTDRKRWPIDRYAKLIDKIYNETKLPVVFCGTSIDTKDVELLVSLIDKKTKYINILGKTSIPAFIQVIKEAKFVITNDTGAYHIAVIEEVPVAIISGVYTYEGFVLYDFKGNDRYKKPYTIVSLRDCKNCMGRCIHSKSNDVYPCLNDITIDNAWKVVKKMIEASD